MNWLRNIDNERHRIAFALSLALAIFYSLPWIALGEQVRMAGTHQQQVSGARVLYLFVSVFFTSLLFFQYNMFWKYRILTMHNRLIRLFMNAMVNLALMLIISSILIAIATSIFSIGAARAFFIFYIFRSSGIMLIVMLVTYVVELFAKSRNDRIEILTLQHQNSETALAALRSQIDPHFLFNSLTSLSGLIRSNSKEAVDFVDHLSDTFRYILEKREHKLVTVKDELHFLGSYVFMIKKRFADGIQIVTNIKDEHLSKNIPQFSLQIMIENALKHNSLSAKNPLIIHISTVGNNLYVRNNLQPKKVIAGYGIGLTNLSKRYQLISGKNIVIKKDEAYFEVELPLL